MSNLNELFEAYQEHPIAYMPIYSKITGSVTAGILLSQIVYWDGKMKHRQFYKTDKDFCNELSMGPSELKNAKKILQKKEIVLITRKGIPAKTHYHLNRNNLTNLLISWIKNSQQVVSKTSNNKGGIKSTTTDTTSENTTEIINNDNAFAMQMNIKGKEAYTLTEHLSMNPSNSEEVSQAIAYYSYKYSITVGKPHPRITNEQFNGVELGFTEQYDYVERENLSLDEYKTIIDSWFEDERVKSDFNIIHFAAGRVIDNHYFKSVY